MLLSVLQALATGNVVSHTDLAKRLNVSKGLLAQMIRDLARKGYLAPVATNAACGGCSGCSQSKGCAALASDAADQPASWVLTEKGLDRVRRYRA